MNFGMITLNKSTKAKLKYATGMLKTLLLIFLLKILTMVLKDRLIHLAMMRIIKDHFQWV